MSDTHSGPQLRVEPAPQTLSKKASRDVPEARLWLTAPPKFALRHNGAVWGKIGSLFEESARTGTRDDLGWEETPPLLDVARARMLKISKTRLRERRRKTLAPALYAPRFPPISALPGILAAAGPARYRTNTLVDYRPKGKLRERALSELARPAVVAASKIEQIESSVTQTDAQPHIHKQIPLRRLRQSMTRTTGVKKEAYARPIRYNDSAWLRIGRTLQQRPPHPDFARLGLMVGPPRTESGDRKT